MHLILIGDKEEDLKEAADVAETIRPTSVTSELYVTDLTDESAVSDLSRQLFSTRSFKEFTHVIFINNADFVQPIKPIEAGFTQEELRKAIQLNVTSPMFLTSECVRCMRDPTRAPTRVAVVNVSSIWATDGAATFGAYSSSKAAMEMFYEVLSKETRGSPIKVLNYSPGPLDSSTQEEIRNCSLTDPNWLNSCCQMKNDGTLINPDCSARKCALLLIQELYESGEHIDYYDQIEGVDYHRRVITTCCANPNCQCGENCRCSKTNGPQCGGCQSFMLGNR